MVKASDTRTQALDVAVLTVSDTRTEENDSFRAVPGAGPG